MTMQCYIYKSNKKEELYLYIEKKNDFSNIPDLLLKSFGNLEFVMDLDLTPNRKLARENSGEVIKQLQEKGFFIQLPPSNTIVHPTLQ
jgi:uncharacterized protein